MIRHFLFIFLAAMTATAQADEIYDCMGRHLFSNNAASAVLEVPTDDRAQEQIIQLAITMIINGEKNVYKHTFYVAVKDKDLWPVLIAETQIDLLGVRRVLFFQKNGQKLRIIKSLYDTLYMEVKSAQTFTFECAKRK